MRAYAIRVATLCNGQYDGNINVYVCIATDLFPHLPQALHTAEQVAAPQQLAANVKSWGYVSG